MSYLVRQLKKKRNTICDFCKECKVKLKINPNDSCKPMYDFHNRKKNKRKELNDSYIAKSNKNDRYRYYILSVGVGLFNKLPYPQDERTLLVLQTNVLVILFYHSCIE